MLYVYLIYGLSFFILWAVLWLYHMKLGRFFLVRDMWMLGLFAVLHGTGDWIGLPTVIQGLKHPAFDISSLVLLIASFYFLLQFGSGTLARRYGEPSLRLLPLLFLVPVVFIAIGSSQLVTGEIFARYLMGFPGSLLTVFALAALLPGLQDKGRPSIGRNVRVACGSFLFYAFFTGLVVPEARFFPADVLNYRTFRSVTGIPIEIFRAVSILGITYAMTRLLHTLEVAAEASLMRRNEELEERVAIRTDELKKVNAALRERELQQEAILNNIPDMAWLKDPDSRFIMVNEPVARSAATEPDKLVGKSDRDLWPEKLAERYIADDREVMKSGSRKRIEEPFVDTEGREVWIETIKTPIYNERGEIIGTTGIARDVTERRKAIEAIRAEQAFRKAIEDSIAAGIVAVDLDGRLTYVNPAFCEMVGWPQEELIGAAPPFAYWPPEDVDAILGRFRQDLSGKVLTEPHELRLMRRSGERFDILIQTSLFCDGTGKRTGLLASITDITDRKKATEALRASEQRYRAVTDNALDGIITIDQDSRIVLANPAAGKIFGYTETELVGQSLVMLMPDRFRETHRASIRRYLASGKRRMYWGRVELPGLHKNGREIPLEMSYGEYTRGGIRFFTGIVRDITSRQEMLSALFESERMRQMIMDSVPALISYVGSDLRYRYVNRQYEMWWKRPASAFIGRSIKEILGEERYGDIEENIKTVLQGRSVFYDWIVPHDHDSRFVQVVYVPHQAADGKVLGFFTLINDVTDLKRAEQALIESERRIQLIISAVPALIAYVGPDLRYRFVNRQYEEWFRRPASEITGMHMREILGEERFRAVEAFSNRAARGERASFEQSLLRDHEERFLHIDYVPHFGVNREVLGFFSLITDITDAKRAEQRLQGMNEKLSGVLNSITEAYYAFDSGWRIVEMNREAEKLLGPSREVVGSVYWEKFPQNIGTEIDRQYHRAMREKRTVHFEARSGITEQWYEIHAYPRAERLEVYFRDISERKKLEEIVQHRAYHDPLTDLPNRLLFEDIIRVEVAQARRNRKKLAVLYLDLDRFKEINDTLGHDVGDELLREAAQRLKKSVRESDTVARIGGDEFNILLSDVVVSDSLNAAVEKITFAFREPYIIGKEELRVTTSIGASIYPDDSRDIGTLLKYADMAMYHAKTLGRNRFQFFDRTLNIRAAENRLLEKRLREALERNEFIPYYLPQVDAKSRTVVGAEVLIRWMHPEHGLLAPVNFIPLAEETGLIIPIGEWLLRTVARQAKVWHEAARRPIHFSVNLSERQFHQRDLFEITREILQESGLEPRWLEFEISEQTAMKDIDFTGPHLQKLSDEGIGLSLDNFGTGRLSLNQLKKLPVRKLKIDQSLIRDIPDNPDDRIIVEAMIAMMHRMNMRAAAEGVETEEQFRLLQERNCDELEGYLFSQPVPAEEFEKLLAPA